MATGRDFSHSQSKIIKRYYANIDTVMTQKLGELVSELYLADTPTKAKTLWNRTAKALDKLDIDPKLVEQILRQRDIEKLALLIGDLSLGTQPRRPKPPTPALASISRKAPASASGTSASGCSEALNASSTSTPSSSDTKATSETLTPAYLRHAFKQFKRKWKLTRLDDESSLGYGPMTSGKRSGVVGMPPPAGFEPEVWEHLVRDGRLKKTGTNFYYMP